MCCRQLGLPAPVPLNHRTRKSRKTLQHIRLAAANQSQAQAVNRDGKWSSGRTQRLRKLLGEPGILKGPCCYDGLSARLIEQEGFEFAFMSGFCVSAARLGAPDAGILSYGEMVDQGRCINEATSLLPIIGDGDTGYGNAMNVKRCVKGYAAAGFAGILIEDQVWPKSCGHVGAKQVVDRAEAVARIAAAADARDEGADIVIIARTDARQAVSLDEALARAEEFAAAGADVLFIDALQSREELEAFCRLGGAAASKPKMANMLEGGGKTPILPPEELEAMGFKLVAYPMSLLGVSVVAMQRALEVRPRPIPAAPPTDRSLKAACQGLREGRVPGPEDLPSFANLQSVVGFPEYFQEAARYAVSSGGRNEDAAEPQQAASASTEEPAPSPPSAEAEEVTVEVLSGPETPEQGSGAGKQPPGAIADGAKAGEKGSSSAGGGPRNLPSGPRGVQRSARFFRIRIADRRTNMVKLETRIPALFIESLETIVPQVSGVDMTRLVQIAKGDEAWDPLQPLIHFDSEIDSIQIWLE
uniref:Phosphoenolpyruvate carboxylase family protein isoform 2 n=1 Tax=Tetraselmis sp. GSL018 TaxID=582737 RepID=A0A061RPP0_9CHLO|eukprot:CAMPEP_0177626944 /NCGR_PEP_ID=MMETSP0419_2-20121207/30936_1 /TAXON_ID=582737 /ORGANISM="Tetraselmis sp., Strain GSL018" /LENGTH=528 /DNA_ID=CAMNT_0019128057 /DNA_START=40 /DNA_END=1626 /DNA_ORIENTATION=-